MEPTSDDEMNKLRASGSVSPSQLSTASSGAPLVSRGSLGGRRPEPTSIAAAQLLCQRQRLEFSAASPPAKQHKKSSSKGQQSRAPDSSDSLAEAEKALAKRWKEREIELAGQAPDKPARSSILRTFSLNEYWSIGQLKYMNLVCLLLSSICLLTILTVLASGNGADPNGIRSAEASDGSAILPTLDGLLLLHPRAEQPSSQALVRPESRNSDTSSADSNESAKSILAKSSEHNKSNADTLASKLSTLERELDEPKRIRHLRPLDSPGSLIDSILGQLLRDSDTLVRPARAGRNSATHGSNDSEPLQAIVRRHPGGATIIISSNMLGSNSDTNEGPATIERLLPPILRPRSMGPLLLGPVGPLMSSPFLGESMDSSGFFGQAENFHHSHLEPPGLLSLIMRASGAVSLPDEPPVRSAAKSELTVGGTTTTSANATTTTNSASNTKTNETLSAQASQSGSQTKSAESQADEFELFDPASYRPSRLRTIYSRPRTPFVAPLSPFPFPFGPNPMQGSMMVISSSSGPPPLVSHEFGPFASGHHLTPPHLMMMGGGERSPLGPMSPLLRSLVGGMVASQLAEAAELSPANNNNNKSESSKSEQIGPGRGPLAATADESDESRDSLARWDEPRSSSFGRPDSDGDQAESVQAADLAQGFSLTEASDSSPVSLVSGTIRQSIRGPGLSVERIIEMPSGRIHQQHQVVPAGVQSQSLSRLADSQMNTPEIGFRSPFGAATTTTTTGPKRSDQEPLLPYVGFVGRLLSDLSSRPMMSSRMDRPPMALDRASAALRGRSFIQDLASDGDPVGDSASSDDYEFPVGSIAALARASPMTGPRLRLSGPRAHRVPTIGPLAEPTGDSSSVDEPVARRHRVGLESALNSMEERLNRVFEGNDMLSSSSSSSSAHAREQTSISRPEANSGQASSTTAKPAAIPLSHISMGRAIQPDTSKQRQPISAEVVTENPLTSPSSPLFGFPSSAAQLTVGSTTTVGTEPKPSGSTQAGSNRQQRSFTYHSNHEQALGLPLKPEPTGLNGLRQQPRSMDSTPALKSALLGHHQEASESGGQADVMGRRFDDSPMSARWLGTDDESEAATGDDE